VTVAPSPARLDSISGWLAAIGMPVREVTPLTGDISLRRYFRARFVGGGSGVVAYYPVKLRAVCRRFRLTTRLLDEVGVPAPAVRRADCARGLMLLDDIGDRTLYDEPERDFAVLAPLYQRAVDYARRIRSLPCATVAPLNPPLDAALLRWELRKSWELVLVPEGLVGDDGAAAALADAFETLCAELGRGERLVPCHRDYMPRNLMRRGDDLLVLDHQDLRMGPPGYDLASLLNDSLFPPASLEDELRAALLPGPQGELDYRRAVVQRAVKAVGNYRDFARRGFDRHVKLIRPTLARAWRSFAAVPELQAVRAALRPAWESFLGDLLD
jgi:aminoglycoside/choline kinase family phosphotransferase